MYLRELLTILAFLILGACTPKPEPKTVGYYLENEQVRIELLSECKNNPGLLKDDPDCINTAAAARRVENDAAKNKTLPPIKF